MPEDTPITDEDRLIYQLQVHRDLIGWVIIKLAQAGIASQRTTGNDPKGDISIRDANEASRVQEIIRDIHNQYNRVNLHDSELALAPKQTDRPHIEIKARQYLYGDEAQAIINKTTVIGVITTGKISKPIKKLFDRSGIAWAENIPKSEFMSESEE